MPYVPSEKTPPKNGIEKYEDRVKIDEVVKLVARDLAEKITDNFSLVTEYVEAFSYIGMTLEQLQSREEPEIMSDYPTSYLALATTIFDVARKYKYDGAFLGELNYAITRLIQELPKEMVRKEKWTSELRYWGYSMTVGAVVKVANRFTNSPDSVDIAIGGVFTDIKDEMKVVVNEAYEHAQIKKSGHCYDGPYYSRVMDVVNDKGILIGTIKVNLERSTETLDIDVLPVKLIAK